MTRSDTDGTENGHDNTDAEAERLPVDGVEGAESESTDKADLPDRRGDLRSEADKWKALARKHEKAFKDSSARLKQYEDQGKTDLERWEERASTAEARAGTAESKARALEIAMERAPEHATVTQIRAVAKRIRGDDDGELEADADELFEFLAPEPKAAPKVGGRPKERLKGGSEPDEEPEETDPRKLAALLPRRR